MLPPGYAGTFQFVNDHDCSVQCSPNPRTPPVTGPAVHRAKRLPGPGAGNYAYEILGLAETSPIGAGVHNRGALQPLQPSPWFAQLAIPMQGLGGLSAGQVYGQPLVNPSQIFGWELPNENY